MKIGTHGSDRLLTLTRSRKQNIKEEKICRIESDDIGSNRPVSTFFPSLFSSCRKVKLGNDFFLVPIDQEDIDFEYGETDTMQQPKQQGHRDTVIIAGTFLYGIPVVSL